MKPILSKAIALALLCYASSSAQDILWEKSYGGKHAEYLLDAQPTADYGFILAGASLSIKSGNKEQENIGDLDYWIWKMNEKGDSEWQKNIGGDGADILQSIKNTRDGGFILAGTSESKKGFDKTSELFGKEDIWIVKLNAKGQEEWQETFGGPGQDLVKVILQTKDGGYVIGGSSSSPMSLKTLKGVPDPNGKWEDSQGGLDYWIIKLDSKGKVKWQKTFGGQYADILEDIKETKDEEFIVAGYSNSPASLHKELDNYGDGDYWILKLNEEGNVLWQKNLGGEQDDHVKSVIITKDDGILVGGNSASASTGNKAISNKKGTDFWLIKLDQEGSILWQETYNTGKTDILTSLDENQDGTILIGGYAQSEVNDNYKKSNKVEINDFIAIKISSEGEEIWKKTVGSSGKDVLTKLTETRDGGYLLAGTSDGPISRDKNTSKGDNDFWVVKLKDKHKEKSEKRQMLEAIPNPAVTFTNVIVGFEFSTGTATVFDLAGRQLQSFEVTSRTIPVDMSTYPEGVYVIEVHTDNGTDSVKILKSPK